MPLAALPVPGLPLIQSGDDLAALIIDTTNRAGIGLEDADIVVITGKVVSKSEGRWVNLNDVQPSERAERLAATAEKDPRLVELVLSESSAIVRARPGNLLVRHRRGYVSAVAGIDRSNVSDDEDVALLLPVDPDGSAAALRTSLQTRSGVRLGVVISDSHGRPFRIGNTGVAIGSAGLTAVEHLEGTNDLFGRALTAASIVPVADLVVSAAMLVSGEAAEGTPVVIVRGLPLEDDGSTGLDLIRPPDRDMFAAPDRDLLVLTESPATLPFGSADRFFRGSIDALANGISVRGSCALTAAMPPGTRTRWSADCRIASASAEAPRAQNRR